jgi:hypothetical protein
VCRTSTFTFPDRTMSNSSLAVASRSARVAVYVASVGRVTYREPFWASTPSSNGGTGPDAFPKLTSNPRGRRQSSEPANVLFPTES